MVCANHSPTRLARIALRQGINFQRTETWLPLSTHRATTESDAFWSGSQTNGHPGLTAAISLTYMSSLPRHTRRKHLSLQPALHTWSAASAAMWGLSCADPLLVTASVAAAAALATAGASASGGSATSVAAAVELGRVPSLSAAPVKPLPGSRSSFSPGEPPHTASTS